MPEEASEWVLVGLDAKIANKRGIPPRIPVPTGELESIGEKGMSVDTIRAWITRFMSTAPGMSSSAWRSENAALVKSFEAFVGKKDAWQKAQDAFAKNDFKTAIGSLRMISAIDPADHAARLNLAAALASTGDHAAALPLLDGIAETWSDDADYHVTRGNVLLALDRRDDAIGAFADALEKDGSHRPAMDALVRLGVLVSIYEDPRDAESLTYVRSDSVLAHLQSVWSAAPREAAYYLDQASYHAMERRFEVSLAASERALEIEGASPSARAVSAKIESLKSLGRVDEATALAKARVETEGGSARSRVDLARCLFAAKKDADAIAELDRAIAADPGDLVALDLRYWPAERYDLNLLQEAIPHLQAHAEAHPAVAGGWRTLGRARLALGDPEAGLALIEKAVLLAPDDDDARAEWWGELLRRSGSAAVLADAAKVTDINKRDWKLRWAEAEAYGVAGRAMEAQAAFAMINRDESLLVDVRKRAKKAAMSVKAAP